MQNSRVPLWPGNRKLAVSLTYDGAYAEHLDVVEPLLEHFGVHGTFYLHPTRVLENVQGWQRIAERGHEIGNGSLLGVADDGRLPNWTLRMVEQDLHMTQEFIQNVFESSECVSFVYPGGEPVCAQGSYQGLVAEAFQNARGRTHGENGPDCDLLDLRWEQMDSMTVSQFKDWKQDLTGRLELRDPTPSWRIFRFGQMFSGEHHGSLLTHELIVTHLADRREDIWIAPIHEVADCIRNTRSELEPQ